MKTGLVCRFMPELALVDTKWSELRPANTVMLKMPVASLGWA